MRNSQEKQERNILPAAFQRGVCSGAESTESLHCCLGVAGELGDGGNGFPGAVAGEGRNLEVQIVNQKPVLETLGSEGRP